MSGFNILRNTLLRTCAPVQLVMKWRHNQLQYAGRLFSSVVRNQRQGFHWKTHFRSNAARLTSFIVAGAILKTEEDEVTEEKKSFEEDKVILILKHAKLAESKGNFDEAGKFYHRVLGMLTEYEKNNAWETEALIQARVHVYDNMANLALSQGNFKEAENLYKETIRGLLQQGTAKDHNAVVEISLKIAMIYAMVGKDEDAMNGYSYAIEMQEKKIENNKDENTDEKVNSLALLGMCLNSYSRYLMLKKRISEAQVVMEKAVTVAKQALGDDSPQVGVLINDVANLASMQGNYDEAIGHLRKAMEVSMASKSEDLAAFHCNLGEVYIRKGNLDEAYKQCSKGYKIASKNRDTQAREVARACLEDVKNLSRKVKT